MNAASTAAFWLMGIVMVAAAVGMVLSRKAVHAALNLALIMILLAVMYAAQDAPFLFAVQIIVYTGAILMLFLFVLMLVGVDASDSLVETIRGQRLAAAVVGVLFGVTTVVAVAQTSVGVVQGLDEANADGNVYGLASLLFSDYVFAFEITGALLTVAVLGAMVLAHRERIAPKVTQRQRARERMVAYAEVGEHPGPLPTPGVFARHNAVDTPALLPDGSVAETSVSRVLTARGAVSSAWSGDVRTTLRQLDPESHDTLDEADDPDPRTSPADPRRGDPRTSDTALEPAEDAGTLPDEYREVSGGPSSTTPGEDPR